MTLRFLEFFAGAGMARLAIGGKLRCVFANDIDDRKAASYRANFGDGEIVVADVANLTVQGLPAGRADLVWASPPCVDISLAGKRGGLNAQRSGAFWGFARLMRDLVEAGRAPTVIAVENVEALLNSNDGADFTAIVKAFADLDYVVGALVIDAALFVPQSRKRLLIVAARGDVTIGAELIRPEATAPFHTTAVTAAHGGLSGALQSRWRWWRLPAPPARVMRLCDVLEPLRGDPADLDRVLRLMSPAHRQKVQDAVKSRAPGETIVGAVNFRRRNGAQMAEVRFDGLAQALRTAGGGSSTPNAARP